MPILGEVQRAIVNYVEVVDQVNAQADLQANSVESIVDMLRKVHGIVHMLELHGAARLTEEMEFMALALRDNVPEDRESALEIWMRAALQLPDYLDRIKAGSPDVPLVLLTLLNDLRAARGVTPLPEVDLFIPDLSPIPDLSTVEINEIAQSEQLLTETVNGLRRRFMRALLDWYRDEQNIEPLGRMSRFIFEIEQVVRSQSVRKVWLVCRAMVDSLYHKGLSPNANIKQLLGQIERTMKDLLDWGEIAFARTQPEGLLTNLLYLIARSDAQSPLINEIKREYRLAELLPHQDKLVRARRILQGPSIELLQVTNQGVRDDISTIKDIIEVYVHADNRELAMLDPISGLLRRVSDTLSMLGIDKAYRLLQPRQQSLREIIDHHGDPGSERLFDIATVLLRIEGMLDSHISDQVGLLGPEIAPTVATKTGNPTLKDLPEREYQALIQSVVKESLRAFARIREALIDYADQSENAHKIKHVPGLLNEITGVFHIMSDNRVSSMLADLSSAIQSKYVDGGVIPGLAEQEKVADTIAGIEYYFESILENDEVHEYDAVLGMIRLALDQLMASNVDDAGEQVATEQQADTGDTDSLVSEHNRDDALADSDNATDNNATTRPQHTDPLISGDVSVAAEPIPQTALKIISEDLDEEILEIFIAEALDEMGVINECLPKWKADSTDEASLTRIRRSFHTLKGSGRLVGAQIIGEFAWSNENLLNYVLRGDLQANDKLFELLNESVSVLPQLIAQLRGQDSQVEYAGLIDSINALTQQSINRQGVLPTSHTKPDPVSPKDPGSELGLGGVELEGIDSNPNLTDETSSAKDNTIEAFTDTELPGISLFGFDEGGLGVNDFIEIAAPEPEAPDLGASEPTIPVLALSELSISESDDADMDTDRTEDARDKSVEIPAAIDTSIDHGIDPVLLDIFSKEARVHLDTLEDIFQQSRELSGIIQPSDKLIRALHTLNGSAQTTQVYQISRLSGPLERVAKYKLELGQAFSVGESGLLKQSIDAVSATLDALLGAWKIPESVGVMAQRVEAYATEILAEIETQTSNRGDQELRKIFIEEAEELVDESEKIIIRWRAAPEDHQPIADIKRQLHTLKGGARMAGYASMADLTHALESSVIAREVQGITPSDRYFDLLQETIDALVVNIEQAKNDQEIGHFDWIISNLNMGIDERELVDLPGASTPAEAAVATENEHADDLSALILEMEQSEAETTPPTFTLEEDAAEETYVGAEPATLQAMEQREQVTDLSMPALEEEEVPEEAGLPALTLEEEVAPADGDAEIVHYEPEPAPGHDEPVDELTARSPQLPTDTGGAEYAAQPLSVSIKPDDAVSQQATLVGQGMTMDAAPVVVTEEEKEAAHPLTEPPREDIDALAVAEPEMPVIPPIVSPVASKSSSESIGEALKDHIDAPPTARRLPDKPSDQVRVRSELLDNLVNNAGEVSIYHSRFGQQIGDMRFNLNELEQTVVRLRGQLRSMDRETEAQILYGYDKQNEQSDREFDPLELDRYSRLQELSRALQESVSDLENIQDTLTNLTRDSETLLMQQSRVSTELQEGLMRTRMVRFDGIESRFSRIVRQTAQSLNKKVALAIAGGENEIDRGVQERMIAPLEHVLRNAVAHGIEMPSVREAADKPTTGKVMIRLALDGGDILIRVVDDGAGIDLESVRRAAIERNMIDENAQLNEQEVLHLLLEPGFSTAREVTQIAGRGVGLDVVAREITHLGGSLSLETEVGVGTLFVMRLPQTLAISQALLVEAAGETYALPINSVRGVSRISFAELEQHYANPEKKYLYADEAYQPVRLTSLLNAEPVRIKSAADEQIPLLMVRSGEVRVAVQIDDLIGRREIVIKSAGQQLSMLRGIAGATLLSDGKVALVLDIGGLLQTMEGGNVTRELASLGTTPVADVNASPTALTIMVVDDSVTIRNVTARMLERYNLEVVTAKDGVDAVSQLQKQKPDLILLDIEMPRMDGFEVAGFVRADARLKDLPIIVISSRTGEKHRQRAFNLGVNECLGKPYQETGLIHLMSKLLNVELKG